MIGCTLKSFVPRTLLPLPNARLRFASGTPYTFPYQVELLNARYLVLMPLWRAVLPVPAAAGGRSRPGQFTMVCQDRGVMPKLHCLLTDTTVSHAVSIQISCEAWLISVAFSDLNLQNCLHSGSAERKYLQPVTAKALMALLNRSTQHVVHSAPATAQTILHLG